MPKQIPFPTRPKRPPEEAPAVPAQPEASPITEANINPTSQLNYTPEESELKDGTPEVTPQKEATPDPTPPKEEMPSDLNMENVVTIGGKMIEIKPTKLKYFRNKTTASYGYIKAIPLTEFLAYDKGIIDKQRDADQMLYDFLVAVFDDSTFVRDNYDEMTADDIDKIIKIFGRLNHIDEKEEAARKNKEAQAKH